MKFCLELNASGLMHEGVHELCDGSLENENLFVGSLDGIE
jgi:hypothetical protein